MNLVHSSGYGLDGSTGADFFSPLSVYTNASSANTGGAAITSGLVTDLSALTLDDYEIRFSGPGAYNVVNLNTDAVVSNGAYTSGAAITFDGLSVVISDSARAPQAGDRFVVSATKNAAVEMGVEVSDPRKIAASSTLAGIPGDNANALALADLREAASIEGTTFSQFYNGIVTDIGTAANDARINYEAQNNFTQELKSRQRSRLGRLH